MAEIDTLLLVNLSERTPYQEIEFFQQMEDQGWQRFEDSYALYAAYPGYLEDREVVAQCERDLRQAAKYSGMDDWDAICLLKESSENPNRLAIAERPVVLRARNWSIIAQRRKVRSSQS